MARTVTSSRSQKRRFIEAAGEAGCSEDEAVFDRAIKQIARAKPSKTKKREEGKWIRP